MDFGPVKVRIGIDETSYRKGYSYMTTVVNHDTNTVIWACGFQPLLMTHHCVGMKDQIAA